MPIARADVPSPPAWPLLGHVPFFARGPLGFVERAARDYGPLVRFKLGARDFYLLSDPALIEQVLVRDAKSFKKDQFTDTLQDVLGLGLLTSEGDFWRRQRKLASVAFQPRHVDAYADAMVTLAAELAARIGEGERADVHGMMMALTLDVVAETLFGAVVRDDADAFAEALEVFQKRYEGLLGTGIVLPRRWPLPIHRAMDRQLARIDRILFALIEARRGQRRTRTDLLETLLAAQDDDGSRMTSQQIRDEAVTLFMAGHETTALTLTYAFRLLTEHPECRTALEREIDEVLGDRAPTRADVPNLPYAEAVVKESMRVLPPVWLIGREPREEVEVAGVRVGPGTTIGFSQWVMHRDPRFWPEAHRFRPERWLDDSTKGLPRYAFFPFGGGPRVCIGNHFAMLEAILLLVSIARRHRVVVDLRAPFSLRPSVTMRPSGPVPARFERRVRQASRNASA